MDDEALSAAFERAVEVARDSKVSLSTEQLLRGYGYYKVATTRKPPNEEDLPSRLSMQLQKRQKWFAHEAAWKESSGDFRRAQELYIAFTEESNSLDVGSLYG